MKFHTHFRFHKDKKVIPPGKSLIFQKKLEIFLKIRFLELAKNFFHWCTIFGFTWCTVVGFMTHVLRKPPSQVICKTALKQSNCKIFQVLISQELFEVWSYFYNVVQFSCKLQFEYVTFFRQACPKCSEKKSTIPILRKDLVHQCGFMVLNDTPPLIIYKSNIAVKNLIL